MSATVRAIQFQVRFSGGRPSWHHPAFACRDRVKCASALMRVQATGPRTSKSMLGKVVLSSVRGCRIELRQRVRRGSASDAGKVILRGLPNLSIRCKSFEVDERASGSRIDLHTSRMRHRRFNGARRVSFEFQALLEQDSDLAHAV